MKRATGQAVPRLALSYISSHGELDTVKKIDLYRHCAKEALNAERLETARKKGFASWKDYEKFKDDNFMRMIREK